MGDGFQVAPEGVTEVAAGLRGRAAELARAGADVARLLHAAAAEVGGPATSAALQGLHGVVTEASGRLTAGVDALADAMHAAARRYVESDRLGPDRLSR